MRWQHPRHGLLEPAAFLDFAEQTDLTERIGEVVLTRSSKALKAWDAAGFDGAARRGQLRARAARATRG